MTRKKIIEALDKEFSKFIRRFHSRQGLCECFTCLWVDDWTSMDCGHYMSRKHISTRWDPDNARPQCRHCNRFNGGEPATFKTRLGDELSERLERESREVTKWSNDELYTLLTRYRNINKKLKDGELRQREDT